MTLFSRIVLAATATAALLAGGMVPVAAAHAAKPAVAGSLAARPESVKRIGNCTARGDFAVCDASGSVNHPSRITVYVGVHPGQHVSGSWDVVCTKGTGAGSKSGSFSGHPGTAHALRHTLKMPYAHPDSCTASADAQLGRGGRLHVWLVARK